MMTPVAMLLRRPMASPMTDVVIAPRKQPTEIWTTSVDIPLPTVFKADVNHTVVYRHYRSNQSLAGLIERIIERITVYCSPV